MSENKMIIYINHHGIRDDNHLTQNVWTAWKQKQSLSLASWCGQTMTYIWLAGRRMNLCLPRHLRNSECTLIWIVWAHRKHFVNLFGCLCLSKFWERVLHIFWSVLIFGEIEVPISGIYIQPGYWFFARASRPAPKTAAILIDPKCDWMR